MFNHTAIALNESVLAYDLNEQRYLFIAGNICSVLGITAKELHQDNGLWDRLINQTELAGIQERVKNLTPNNPIELTYSITTPQYAVKNIADKKRLIIDDATGHKILISVIIELPANNHLEEPEQPYVLDKPDEQADATLGKQFLNSLVDSQTSFLIRVDINGNYSFVNQQYLKTFGYAADDILGKHFSITTIPEETHLCQNAFVECINNPGKVIPLLHKKPDVQGNLHDTEWELMSIVNKNGEVCEIQGIGRDITAKLKIEEEIKRTAQKLDDFIENLTDSFFILDNDWRFVRVNAAFEKVWGKSRTEVLGKIIWDVFPSFVNTVFNSAFYEAKTKQKSVKFMTHFEPLNKWFRTVVYPSAEGITVFSKNVTYEMRAQEEALWAQNNLEALINNTTDKIWSVDTEGRYVYMNNAYIEQTKAITGIAPKRGKYSYKNMGYPQHIIDEWMAYYKRALQNETYTVIIEGINGNTKQPAFYEVNFNPIYAGNGEIKGVGCFAHDITARLKTEHEVLGQNKRLRNIAALSSHELRRPVASLLGLINLIDMENLQNPDNKQIFKYLQVVSTEIDDVIRLIVDHTFTGD